MKNAILAVLGVSIVATAGAANAAIITRSLEVTASGFSSSENPGAMIPYDNAAVSFSVTFDNNADIETSTDGLTIFSNSFPYDVSYSYRRDIDYLTVGTFPGPGVCGVPPGEDVFCFFLFDISTESPTSFSSGFNYQVDDVFFRSETVQVSNFAAGVPEPATWAFMIFGFGAIGGAMRLQRKANVKVSYA